MGGREGGKSGWRSLTPKLWKLETGAAGLSGAARNFFREGERNARFPRGFAGVYAYTCGGNIAQQQIRICIARTCFAARREGQEGAGGKNARRPLSVFRIFGTRRQFAVNSRKSNPSPRRFTLQLPPPSPCPSSIFLACASRRMVGHPSLTSDSYIRFQSYCFFGGRGGEGKGRRRGRSDFSLVTAGITMTTRNHFDCFTLPLDRHRKSTCITNATYPYVTLMTPLESSRKLDCTIYSARMTRRVYRSCPSSFFLSFSPGLS